jgi:Rrf2 family protein
MLSTSCKYALRAMVLLMSKATEGSKMGIIEIAKAIDANEHTTAKILQLLAREGFIHSVKGPKGGFYMQPDAATIYLIDIVKLIDGVHFFFECGLGLKECSETKPCPIHNSYKGARELLHREFSTISIQQLSKDISLGKAYLHR